MKPPAARRPGPARTRPSRTRALALACCAVLALGACGSEEPAESGPKLTVEGAYLPEPVTADMAAGFLVVRNEGDADDQLVRVESELSADVQVHQTIDNRMRQTDSLPVPAGGELRLERGGSHLMFMDLRRQPLKGEEVSVKLHFATSDPIALKFPVEVTHFVPDK